MAYEIIIKNYENYILAEMSGERCPGSHLIDSRQAWTEILEACKSKGVLKVLVISKLTGHLGAFPMLFIVEELVKMGISRNYQLAYVDLNKESISDNRFGETAAHNRGFYYVKVFDNVEPALTWLLSLEIQLATIKVNK